MSNDAASSRMPSAKLGSGGNEVVFSMPQPNVTVNLPTTVIVIAEDRATICLQRHLGHMERRNEWHTPAGLVISLALTLATAEFRNTLFLEAPVWKAIFVLCTIASIFWLVKALVHLKKSRTVDDLIADFKTQSENEIPSKPVAIF